MTPCTSMTLKDRYAVRHCWKDTLRSHKDLNIR